MAEEESSFVTIKGIGKVASPLTWLVRRKGSRVAGSHTWASAHLGTRNPSPYDGN